MSKIGVNGLSFSLLGVLSFALMQISPLLVVPTQFGCFFFAGLSVVFGIAGLRRDASIEASLGGIFLGGLILILNLILTV